jgi:hypothetical protein
MARVYQGSIIESLGRLFATGTATAMGEAEFGAVMFAIKAPWIAAAFSLCFAVANVVGTALWSRCDRLRPYAAMQLLILVIGVSGTVAIASVDVLRPAGAPPDANWDEIRSGRLPLLAIVAGLMASFAFMEWDTKKAKESGKT